MNNARPHLTMLTEEQKQEIHQYTLRILAKTGVRVDSPSALEMLRRAVSSLMVDERTVRLGNKLPHYDMVSTVGIVRDVPEHLPDLYRSLEHFANGRISEGSTRA